MTMEPVQKVPQEAEAIDNGHFGSNFIELRSSVFFDFSINHIRRDEQVVVDPLGHVSHLLNGSVDVV